MRLMRLPALLALLCLLAASCGGSDDETSSTGDATPATPDAGPPPAVDTAPWMPPDLGPVPDVGTPAPPVSSCEGFSVPTQLDYTLKLTHGGQQRTALVHIPPGYDASTPVALVFNNHGSMFYAQPHATMTHLNEWADKRDVVTVTPQGTGGMFPGWNVGKSPMGQVYTNVDDVGFFSAMIDELSKTICVDSKRVYCTGFSLGGSMCYRLSCDLTHRIAAIASVSGPDGTETCSPTRAVPLLHIHGTADSWAAYKGDNGANTQVPNKGAEGSVIGHAKRSGCNPQAQVTLTQGQVTCKSYSPCQGGVGEATLCTVEGGGHTWPGGDGWLLGGTVNKDINASQMILDFFLKYALP